MATTSRRTRNYKDKNSLFAFGHFALPVAAFVALGLLFIGIKLFFMNPSGPDPKPPVGPIIETSWDADPNSGWEDGPKEVVQDQPGNNQNLAGPIDGENPSRTTNQPEDNTQPQRQQAPRAEKWAVQLGAFSNPEGAATMADQAKKQGYTANITKVDVEGKTYHRVRVAAGNTKGDAEKVEADLKKKGFSPVMVVPPVN
jgi:hypothetical protein